VLLAGTMVDMANFLAAKDALDRVIHEPTADIKARFAQLMREAGAAEPEQQTPPPLAPLEQRPPPPQEQAPLPLPPVVSRQPTNIIPLRDEAYLKGPPEPWSDSINSGGNINAPWFRPHG
jgi:hypothetical protein